MKFFYMMAFSIVCGLGSGFFVAWPSAHQWNVMMPSERLVEAGYCFVASAFWTVLLKSRELSGFAEDTARTLAFLVGAALCFLLVRGEVTLLVYSALWAIPGAFFGAVLLNFLPNRRTRASAEVNASS